MGRMSAHDDALKVCGCTFIGDLTLFGDGVTFYDNEVVGEINLITSRCDESLISNNRMHGSGMGFWARVVLTVRMAAKVWRMTK